MTAADGLSADAAQKTSHGVNAQKVGPFLGCLVCVTSWRIVCCTFCSCVDGTDFLALGVLSAQLVLNLAGVVKYCFCSTHKSMKIAAGETIIASGSWLSAVSYQLMRSLDRLSLWLVALHNHPYIIS